MKLGINFPWVTCGHDFGPRPPPWAAAPPTDWGAVEAELTELRGLGLEVVRWWIFGNGVNLPCGVDPSTIARRRPFGRGFPRHAERWVPDRALPRLSLAFLDDLERLLDACARSGVALWPSLVSFEVFLPIDDQVGGVTSQGRGLFAFAPEFFDTVLEPILEVAERHRSAIAAFEVANEPGWALVPGWKRARFGDHPPWTTPAALGAFLVEGARRVARRGLRASVGFLHAAAPWLPPSDRSTLRHLAERGAYVHQIHHYPSVTGIRYLPAAERSPILPCWVGEVSTSRAGRWAGSGLAEDDPESFLSARLRLIEELGYEGALLWAQRADDPHVGWDEVTKAQVRAMGSVAG